MKKSFLFFSLIKILSFFFLLFFAFEREKEREGVFVRSVSLKRYHVQNWFREDGKEAYTFFEV